MLSNPARAQTGFRIRPASIDAGDHEHMIDMYDSQIPWLRSIGAGLMWSSEVRGIAQKEKGWYNMIAKCDENFVGAGYTTYFGKDWSRAFIAEVQVNVQNEHSLKDIEDALGSVSKYESTQDEQTGNQIVSIPVGAIVVNGISAKYTHDVLPEQDSRDPFVFIDLLVTDRRVKSLSKGSGAALIHYVKEEVLSTLSGVNRLALDCFVGKDGRLVKYYEQQGFQMIGSFVYTKKEGDWNGVVLEMRL